MSEIISAFLLKLRIFDFAFLPICRTISMTACVEHIPASVEI